MDETTLLGALLSLLRSQRFQTSAMTLGSLVAARLGMPELAQPIGDAIPWVAGLLAVVLVIGYSYRRPGEEREAVRRSVRGVAMAEGVAVLRDAGHGDAAKLLEALAQPVRKAAAALLVAGLALGSTGCAATAGDRVGVSYERRDGGGGVAVVVTLPEGKTAADAPDEIEVGGEKLQRAEAPE